MSLPSLLLLLILWNVTTFLIMGADKLAARMGWWRIPELFLLTMALLLGGVGAWLGSHLFHHKTRKPVFRLVLPLAALLTIAISLYIFTQV